MITYEVVSREPHDESGTTVHQDHVFDDKDYAHSSHLKEIMKNLDNWGLDLISITVKSIEKKGK